MEFREPCLILLGSGSSKTMSVSKRHCLVWLRGIRGPTPQVWSPDYVDLYRNSSETLIIALRELDDEEQDEPLDRLVSKYPVPSE